LDKHVAEFEKRRKQMHFKISGAPPVQLVLYLDKNKRQSWIRKALRAEYYCQTLKGSPLRPMQAQQQDKKFLPFDLIYSCVWAACFICLLESGRE
jgi:hypothetical protein